MTACPRCGADCCDAEWAEYKREWSPICGGRCDGSGSHATEPAKPHVKNGPDCTCPNDEYHDRVYGTSSEGGGN